MVLAIVDVVFWVVLWSFGRVGANRLKSGVLFSCFKVVLLFSPFLAGFVWNRPLPFVMGRLACESRGESPVLLEWWICRQLC